MSSSHIQSDLDEIIKYDGVAKLSIEEHNRGIFVEQISWKPRAYVLHNFLTPEECDHIITIGSRDLSKSKVIDSETGDDVDDPIRTSYQSFLRPEVENKDKIVIAINERIARYSGLPVENGEGMQVIVRKIADYMYVMPALI